MPITGAPDACVLRAMIAPGAEPPKASPQPVPSPPPSPVAPPAPPAPVPAAVTIGDVVAFPSSRRCVSRRRFRIRLRERRGIRTHSATVAVNGKQVRVVRGKRLRAPVDLRGLPEGRFKGRIALALEDGRTIAGTRRYRTCTGKRRSGRRIRV